MTATAPLPDLVAPSESHRRCPYAISPFRLLAFAAEAESIDIAVEAFPRSADHEEALLREYGVEARLRSPAAKLVGSLSNALADEG